MFIVKQPLWCYKIPLKLTVVEKQLQYMSDEKIAVNVGI